MGRTVTSAVLDPHQDLRRAADDVDVVAVEVVQVRRRVERPEIAIGEERIRRRQIEPTGEHGLEGVAGGDVLLDPAYVVLKALVRVWPGRSGSGGQRLDLEGRAGGRCGQPLQPAFDSGLSLIVEPAQVLRVGPGRHFDGRDDRGAVEEVVEHQQRVGHHQDRIRELPVVRRRIGQRLDGADDIVARGIPPRRR